MQPGILTVATLLLPMLLLASCRTATAPTAGGGALDQWLVALRQQGLAVAPAERIPPDVNRFFTVPAQQVSVNGSRLSAFEYPSADAATADAARVSADGQPNPLAQITWVSTPRFYRQGALIVLYVGCTAEIVQALDGTLGPAFVVGAQPCR